MEIFRKKAPRIRHRVQTQASYATELQFYTNPPVGEISLKEFDDFALERLKILRAVERISLSGEIKYSDDWMNKIYEDFKKNKYFILSADKMSGNNTEDVISARRKDHLSHFILRLAYCRTEELRRWFVAQEVDLFRARFMRAAANGGDFSAFLQENNLNFSQISESELNEETKNLADGTYNISGVDQLENKIFYKVHFIDALDLVQGRKVFLKDGFAYVPNTNIVSLIYPVFRSKISEALTVTCRALPKVDDDARLLKLLRDFDKRYTGSDYNQPKGNSQQITPEMIQHLSASHFPLCMRHLQDNLVTHNHLKHGGRMQYGLFLKAAGLKLEDALKFWRSHFTKVIDSDKFDKQYAYSIRHNYGKEGKRVDYSPYSCIKIIMSNVGPGEFHGCPFKHSDASSLKQKLINFATPQNVVSEIVDLASSHHYQIACHKFFESKHHSVVDGGINHPNQYFEESVALKRGSKMPTSASRHKSGAHALTSSQNTSYSSSQLDVSAADSTAFDEDAFENSLMEIDAPSS